MKGKLKEIIIVSGKCLLDMSKAIKVFLFSLLRAAVGS